MHIGNNELASYQRVAGALGVTQGVSLQAQEAAQKAQPDASGTLSLKDEFAEVQMQVDTGSGNLKSFQSVILQDLQAGEQHVPKGTKTQYSIEADQTQVFQTEVPGENGTPISAKVEVAPTGEMRFNGQSITQEDQQIFQAVNSAQTLSLLTTQLVNNAVGLLDTTHDQNQAVGALKLADASAQVVLETTSSAEGLTPNHFRADYYQDIGQNGQVEIPAGSTIEWQLTPTGCQKIESVAPVGDQLLKQELVTNLDGSYEFNQYFIPKG
jgi:hypothetical protein